MSDLNVYTTSAINALTPITGDMVVDSDLNAVKLYDGSAWRVFNSDSTVVPFQNRWGASFDRWDAHMTVGTGVNPTGSATVSMWFRRTGSVSGYGGNLIGTHNIFKSGFNNSFAIALKNGTDLTLESYNYQTGIYTTVATNVASTNTWYHLALVLTYTDSSTSSAQFYIDGSTVGSALALSGRTLAGLNEGFFIGAYDYNGAGYFFPGQIDDLAIFDSALDQTAITALYGGGTPSAVSGAIGYWRMGDDSSDSPVDAGNITGITNTANPGTNDATTVANKQPTFSALASSETIYV